MAFMKYSLFVSSVVVFTALAPYLCVPTSPGSQEGTDYDTERGTQALGRAVSVGGSPVSAQFICECGAQEACALPRTLLTVGTWMFR